MPLELTQILIRPEQRLYAVQFRDGTGRSGTIRLDGSSNPAVTALVTDAQARLPAESERPDKPEIQQEIVQLEVRLRALRRSIGTPD